VVPSVGVNVFDDDELDEMVDPLAQTAVIDVAGLGIEGMGSGSGILDLTRESDDTSLGAAGMARYGEREAVALLLGEIYGAASHFQMRLPELFCGFEREPGEPPIAYPVACLPQAWAAGSVFLMLQASLGVSIDAIEKRVDISTPHLPNGIDRLNITNLKVGDASLDLVFTRMDGHVVVTPNNKSGDVQVRTLR
jgi:hypothetical protein